MGGRYDDFSSFHVTPPIHRMISRAVFRLVLGSLFNLGHADTLFGVKGFRRNIARHVFEGCCVNSPAYDVEIILRLYDEGRQLICIPVAVMNGRSSVIAL